MRCSTRRAYFSASVIGRATGSAASALRSEPARAPGEEERAATAARTTAREAAAANEGLLLRPRVMLFFFSFLGASLVFDTLFLCARLEIETFFLGERKQ